MLQSTLRIERIVGKAANSEWVNSEWEMRFSELIIAADYFELFITGFSLFTEICDCRVERIWTKNN